MPIQILDYPEPLSVGALASAAEPVLIKSDAYHQLLHELRRYCNLQASGRSFLIAGHRGSGKTTLVLSAFEKILRESQANAVDLRPLMVPLLGPSLLPDPAEKDLAAPGEGAASGEKKLTEFENVLVQLTLALHRAVVRELTQAYRDRMIGRKELDAQGINAFLEAPGQLALELDEYPGKARLREFWKRADALPRGLLSRRVRTSTDQQMFSDQGIRELVALCSVSEAYRRISGSIQVKKKDEAGAESSDTQTREVEVKGKEFFAPLIALLTGGAVASGVVTFNPDRIGLAALAGVLTALGAAVVSKYSSSRSQKRSESQEDLFIPNLSVATLDRVLPLLLERIRDAGLAPVFVIDELDKVENLSERIPDMVKRLKKLVAESAFFCFLTDRRYFEEMRCRNIVTPYSIEYTYFTNQLFVAFRHTELHTYLGRLLSKPNALTASATATVEERNAVTDRDEEIADHAVLPYVVLHAAQMHPIDLRREVAAIRGPDDFVALPLGSVRSLPRRRLELQMQVAIELLLENEKLEWELGRDPAFRRLAHDALYFISRRWQTDTNDLRFDKASREEFAKYLTNRMKTELPDTKESNGDSAASGNGETPPERKETKTKKAKSGKAATKSVTSDSKSLKSQKNADPPLERSFTPRQADFLWDFVRELAELLAEPTKIRSSAIRRQQELALKNPRANPRFAAQVLGALNFTDPGPLLERAPGSTDIFNWRYDRSGRPLFFGPVVDQGKPAAKEAPVPGEPIANLEVELIDTLNATLLDLSGQTVNCGNLGTTFGVISPSPAWPSVQPALERLKKTAGEYPEKPEDISIVGQFAEVIRRGAESIALGIYSGWVIGSWRKNKSEQQVFVGLQTFSAALRLKALHEEQGEKRIHRVGLLILNAINRHARVVFSLTDAASVKAWRQELEALIEHARGSALLQRPITPHVHSRAWQYWRRRLRQIDAVPNLSALMCAIAHEGPSQVLSFPPEEMTARNWSDAFYAAIVTAASSASSEPPTEDAARVAKVPVWLGIVALQRLGFSPQLDMLPEAARLLFKNVDVDQPSLPEVRQWKVFAPAKGGEASAIIVSKADTESEKWHPTTGCPALILRPSELLALQKLWQDNQKFLLRWLGQRWLVFDWSIWQSIEQRLSERMDELPVYTTEEFRQAIEIAGSFVPSSSPIPAIVPREWRGSLPPPFVAIAVPGSLDELFAVISQTWPRNTPTQ